MIFSSNRAQELPIKGKLVEIKSTPLFKKWHARFNIVLLNPVFDQYHGRYHRF